jgi:hypothetical protein
MKEKLIPFKKFYDYNLAVEVKEHLEANNIECIIEENAQYFSPSITGASLNNAINLKINPADFNKARDILFSYYLEAIKSIDKDYYLFEFSDQELFEIISKPDEWGELDFILAQEILKDRGKEIKPELLKSLGKQRLTHLSKKEKTKKYLIYKGYFWAFFGGLGAIIFGYDLANSKKIMPNGDNVYTYDEEERKHGERIFQLGCISLIIWVVLILFVNFQKSQQ